MYMRNALVAAVGLQYLVEGILAQDKVTLTKTVTKRKSSSSVTAEEATEDITTVVPTSYITDGTTIWVEETITIPCSASACTATQTTGSVDAESTAETADAAGTSSESSVDGTVTEQTADITTVVPTSYITDGTTIFVDETITIPCSKCEAASTAEAESTAETADANTTAETADAASTSEPVDGNVTEQTADITTVVPTSYITDGTTIFVDETITIPCTKCEATETGAESTAETADANTTGAESTAETADANTTTETADAATSSLPVDDGNVTEQTADITTVVPTTYVTEGTTITEEQTITIPCTKCAATQTTGEAESTESTAIVPSGDNTAETSAASETQSVASSQDADGTTSAEETGTQTAGTASDDAETSTEVESTIPTSFSTNILSTGFGGSTATGPTGLFPNTSIAVETSAVASTIVPVDSTATTGEVKTSGTAVVSKIPKPVIVVIREVTIFHRTIVIGAACPPVKAGNSGNFIVGRDSEEKSFTEIGDALTDACNKQFKACSTIAGKNFRVADCQKQLTNCLADAASTAKAPTPVTKESTETASIILPSDATITGESKSYIGNGNVVISTRTLTVSESCEISDGTPVIKGPTATGETAVETTADAETTTAAGSDAETTSAAESDAESTQDVATTEASEEVTGTQTGNVVTSITMTNSNGEVTVTAITLTTGQPTGTGAVSVPTGADSTQDVATTEATEEVTGTQGVESSAIVITMTKSDGEISVTSITLSTAGPSGTGAVSIPYGPGADETSVPAPEATDSSAIGQDTTAVPSGTNGVVTVTVGGNTDGVVTVTVGGNTDVVTQTVTAKVTETETVTVGCGANGSQSAATIISIVTTCPESTTLATATSTRVPETVYVTETVEFARQTATPDTPQRLRRMLGFSW
ncbi:hypothetical protein NW757_001338 [Fusarium falciforme]|nr:hypothetical protein NW757_001338 [Fusarium falciforme]